MLLQVCSESLHLLCAQPHPFLGAWLPSRRKSWKLRPEGRETGGMHWLLLSFTDPQKEGWPGGLLGMGRKKTGTHLPTIPPQYPSDAHLQPDPCLQVHPQSHPGGWMARRQGWVGEPTEAGGGSRAFKVGESKNIHLHQSCL